MIAEAVHVDVEFFKREKHLLALEVRADCQGSVERLLTNRWEEQITGENDEPLLALVLV